MAIVGSGYFARFHWGAWRRIADASKGAVALVAAASLDRAGLHEKGAAFGVEALFEDAASMLDESRPDLVDIVTPEASHAALVAEAAGRGIDVVCQKPLAPGFEQARAIVEGAEAAGIMLAVHENFRFQPWHQEARRWVTDGRLGRLFRIAFRLRPGDGQGSDAYLSRQPYFQRMERFLIHETGIHFIDVFRFLVGEVRAVTARLERLNPVIAGEDAGLVLFEFEGGVMGLFDGNRLNEHDAPDMRLTMGEMWLEGERGVLRLDGRGRLFFKPLGEAEAEIAFQRAEGGFAGDCVHALNAHIVHHLLEGTPLANSGRDYLKNIAVEEAIYASHERRARVCLEGQGQ